MRCLSFGLLISFGVMALSMETAAAQDAQGQKSNLIVAPCDAGERQQFELVECDIELRNTGNTPIMISKGEGALQGDRIDQQTLIVPPNGSAYLRAYISTRDNSGYIKRSFRFATTEPGRLGVRGASVTAFVTSILDVPTPTIDFGAVRTNEKSPTQSVQVTSREVKDFKLLGIASSPSYLAAVIDGDGHTVQVTVRPDAPWGLMHEKVKLKTSASQQPEAWVTVDANIIGDIASNGNPFSLGLMRTGQKNEFLIRLTSRSKSDIQIGKFGLQKIKGTASSEDCSPKEKGCRLIRLKIDDDQPLGRLQGVLDVEFVDIKQHLPIELVGMLLSPETKVHDFNQEVERTREQQGGAISASSSAPPNKIDVDQAIRSTIKGEIPPPPGNGPLLKWSVANESTLYGYLIYRSDDEKGPFVRVNKEIIRTVEQDDRRATATHVWRDNSAEPGKEYWYYIGTIDQDGAKKDLTRAQKVLAK